MSLREKFNEQMKAAMRAKDQKRLNAIRLILAALKDRDIAARPSGNSSGIGESEIEELLMKMVKQRQESITLYKQGNRADLVQQEEEEIAIIERFMPKQMDEGEAAAAIDAAVAETGAQSVKDMGKVMAKLKERFAGRLDLSKAGALVRQRLSQ